MNIPVEMTLKKKKKKEMTLCTYLYFLNKGLFCCVCNFFLWCGPFLMFLLDLLPYCFCFMFLLLFVCFGCEACEILAPQLRIEPTPPALKGKVLPLDHQQSPFLKIFYLFVYWAVPCLSFGTWGLWSSLWHAKSLVAAYELLLAAFGI